MKTLRGTGSRTQQRVLKSGNKMTIRFRHRETCAERCVCERSVGTGTSVRGIENHLARTRLGCRKMQISDNQQIEKVFHNLRQELNRSENADVLHEKTNVLIW